jgi:hypothetical protein
LSLLGGFHRASAAACTRLPPPNPLAVGPPGSRLGFRPRELSHFSDNAGCGLSVATQSPLRGPRPIPTACRPCRSVSFWLTECDPPRAFTLPGYSPRSTMHVPFPFAALPLAGQGRFRGRSGTAGGAIRPYRPPACPAARRGSDSDCEAFAADGGLHHRLDPGNTQAAYCRSRFRLPLAVAVWVVTRRRSLSGQPRLALPLQTYLPCGQAALG